MMKRFHTASVAMTIAFYTCAEALRNRIAWLAGLVLLTGFFVTQFLGSVAITETAPFQAAFMGAFLRLAMVVLLAILVVTGTLREFHDKGVELVLSLALPRWAYLVGKLGGFVAIGVALALACTLLLMLHSPWQQCVVWGLSLACELFIVSTFSMLCLLSFNQVTAALSAVGAFYVGARTIAALQLMAHGPVVDAPSVAQQFVEGFVSLLAYLLPDLSLFGMSHWLAHASASWSSLWPIALQSLIYVSLLGAASMFDLYRKEF